MCDFVALTTPRSEKIVVTEVLQNRAVSTDSVATTAQCGVWRGAFMVNTIVIYVLLYVIL